MSNCNICLRRARTNLHLEILTGYTQQNIVPAASLKDAINRRCFMNRRNHATVASIKKGHHRRVLKSYAKKDLDSIPNNKRRAAPGALSKGERRDALARDRNKLWLLKERSAEAGEDEDGDEDKVDRRGNKILPLSPSGNILRRHVKAPEKAESSEESRKPLRFTKSLTGRHETSEQKLLVQKDQRIVENYLRDPLRLADAVLDRLKASDVEGALRYVRASEAASINSIVSWNHCMDWLMAQGEMKEALAVYNDMKKRGRKPDAHTYTIMLRGLSTQVHKRGAVDEAVKIYNSMYAPNSAVTPNSIHTNAAINVCARGGDMDALWAITGKMPERGPGSPDRITYTTIFNAIRDNTIRQVSRLSGNSPDKVDARRQIFRKAVDDARKVWEDVSWKWRRADLIIDEQLVCAMGRLLLGCGSPKEMFSILDLIDATMNLRVRKAHKRGTPSLPGLTVPVSEPEPVPEEDVNQEAAPNSEANKEQSTAASDFESVMPMAQPSPMPLSASSKYAKPGPKTLSLLLDVCIAERGFAYLAPTYWHTLTKPNGEHRIVPDAAHIMAYLRVLRVNRASQAAYETLSAKWPDHIAKQLYRRGPFVVAIRTCVRDKNNPNVFRIAMRTVDLMQQKLEERALGMYEDSRTLADMHGGERKKEIAKLKREQMQMTAKQLEELAKDDESVQRLPIDPYVLESLLVLATRTTKGWNEGVRGKDDGEIFERDHTRNHTMIALKRVGSLSLQLKKLMFTKLNEIQNGTEGVAARGRRDPRFGSRVGDEMKDLVLLTRTLISTCNKVVDIAERFKQAGRAELDQKTVENCRNWMRIYNAYLSRVEQALGPDFLKKGSLEEDQRDDEDEDPTEDDDEDIAPLIERQIRAALGEATTEMLQARDLQKGRSVRHVGDVSVPPKFKSRVMERQYDTKLQKAMKARDLDTRNTGYAPFGSDVVQAEREVKSDRKAGTRRPMIGDELDLDSHNIDEALPSWAQGDDVPFAADNQNNQRGQSRILDRSDVKRAWQSASQHSSSQLRRAAAAY